jgi:hypothetical protein
MPSPNPSAVPAPSRLDYQPTPRERVQAVSDALNHLTTLELEMRHFEAATRKAGSLKRAPFSLLEEIAETAGKLDRALRFVRHEIEGGGDVVSELVHQARTVEDEVRL